jgi:hypothetical protein
MSGWRQTQHEDRLANDGEHIPYDNRYWTAQICSLGHVQNGGSRVVPTEKYCECGAETIHQCPYCKNNIKGALRGYADRIQRPPMGCLKCGNAYPWTQTARERVGQLIDDSELSADGKQQAKSDLDSILKNAPGAEIAARRTHGW